jgi:hypothetical protein
MDLVKREMAMTAEERTEKWLAELEEVERMTPSELLAEVKKLAREETFIAAVATAAIIASR